MKMSINFWSRKLHRWGAIAFCLPLLVVICTGLLLQVKKQWSWVQPPTQSGVGTTPEISWEDILRIAKENPNLQAADWSGIDRLDVQPRKGIVKVQGVNHWELQLDLQSGEVLSSTYRRSDLIESLHDGSWFGDGAKLWVFLANGLVLLGLWISGLYLWWLPFAAKRKKKRRKLAAGRGPADE